MPSLTVIYYAGLIPAALLLMARAMWLANHDRIPRPVAIGLCMIAAIVWPVTFAFGIVIALSELTRLDGWIDAYLSWLERMAKRWLP